MMKITVLCEHDINGDPHGCSHIRLLRPLCHPTVKERAEVSFQSNFQKWATDCDAVIVERFFSPHMTLAKATEVVKKIKNSGAKFLYTLDDNLLDLGRDTPWRSPISCQQRQSVGYFIKHADGVIVSTPLLKERISRLNQKVIVIPNHLDEQLFTNQQEKHQKGDIVKIGYMGTLSHHADLMKVVEPLRAVLHEWQGKVVFEVLGITDDNRIDDLFKSLPFTKKNPDEHYRYPDFIPWALNHLDWDMAIAPLENRSFNYYKSDIKFLDYTMLGFPGIYSLLPDTQLEKTFADNENCGLFAQDSPDSWHNALTELVGSASLRDKILRTARQYVSKERTLAQRAIDWPMAIEKIIRKGV